MPTPSSVPTDRQLRAANEEITVHPNKGRAAGANGLVIVETEDNEYLVDLHDHVCECDDFHYRVDPVLDEYEGIDALKPCCKHLYRVRWVMGEAPIPAAVILEADVDDGLGSRVEAEVDVEVLAAPNDD